MIDACQNLNNGSSDRITSRKYIKFYNGFGENTDDPSENGKNHPFELISTERDIKFIIHNHISICLIIAQNTKNKDFRVWSTLEKWKNSS